jgi:hypothetical protein
MTFEISSRVLSDCEIFLKNSVKFCEDTDNSLKNSMNDSMFLESSVNFLKKKLDDSAEFVKQSTDDFAKFFEESIEDSVIFLI